jgi:drug/metabolite transporter (DMT)-like permease
MTSLKHPGVAAALGAAILFGAGTPLAKVLLGETSPWLLAGILYLGSGIGLAAVRWLRRSQAVILQGRDWGWLAGAVLAGGVAGPVLLMWGLAGTSASAASLLLNAEGVLTALIAWFVFRENFDRRIALGMAFIVAGAALLAWPHDHPGQSIGRPGMPALAILGACLAWAIDNNLTRKISLTDAAFIAMVKGVAAGATNVVIALAVGSTAPAAWVVLAGGTLGFLSYGISLVLFVIALRHLGTARTGAYFSTAPFVGALLSVLLLGDALGLMIMVAALLMGVGVWLHMTERHVHEHRHEALEHEHEHEHDAHHQHAHEQPVTPRTRHSHRHRHEVLTHSHPHYPDAHHRHKH